LELLAQCCKVGESGEDAVRPESNSFGSSLDLENASLPKDYSQQRRGSINRLSSRDTPPDPLDEELAIRLIDAVRLFSRPISESYVLSAANILDDVFKGIRIGDPVGPDDASTDSHLNGAEVSKLLLDMTDAIEAYNRSILEYVSHSNWPQVFDCLRSALQQAAHQPLGNAVQVNAIPDEDRNSLVTIRLISSFRVDSRKLSFVIQELCGSFLHLRKAYQTTVAIVLPLLITRWLERNPEEFRELHTIQERLDGGAETLFDMTNTMFDGGRRKALLFPFQTSLLFLLPEVFEVASHMRDNKSGSISKKVSFLEMLRKALRNRNETAIYCLTSVLRVARHFPPDSEAALLSYALDIQEEVKEAVFRRYTPGTDAANIDSSLMTAAFVGLAHLNFENCVESLTPLCLAPNTPPDFKIAVVSACSHFARQVNADEYQPLFAKVAEFVRAQLKVCLPTYMRSSLSLTYPRHLL
jgi:neurofibromin 1